VHLKLEFDWTMAPIYDVIAVMPGSELPDEWIVRGNHHDGWVNGALDPTSGMVAVLEEARAIGRLAKTGWRPKRTLVYAAWDGEEPGLLGSTEWAETHAAELARKAVVYINSDTNSRGFLSLNGSHTLERFLNQVARDVEDPSKKVPAFDRARAQVLTGDDKDARKDAKDRADLRLAALGSGSDYTPFLQHLGVAALDVSFGGEEHYGQYHSIYDSIDHFEKWCDPGFTYGVALSKLGGRTVLRLANAETLPFEFTAFADAVGKYLKEVQKLADDMREETAETNRYIAERTFELAADQTQPFVAPAPKPAVPHLNFAPLENAVQHVKESAERYEKAAKDGLPSALEKRKALDAKLLSMERALTTKEGLPGRPWYVHQIYAPGQYTGYGVKTLPAVREAIELRDFAEAEKEGALVAKVLDGYAAEVDAAAALTKP
jgi:N-acetylated-alpha-linked acidic dipeptidase